jgi:hypothetical protein
MQTFTKDTALLENGRGAAWHGMGTAWHVWINLYPAVRTLTSATVEILKQTKNGQWYEYSASQLPACLFPPPLHQQVESTLVTTALIRWALKRTIATDNNKDYEGLHVTSAQILAVALLLWLYFSYSKNTYAFKLTYNNLVVVNKFKNCLSVGWNAIKKE